MPVNANIYASVSKQNSMHSKKCMMSKANLSQWQVVRTLPGQADLHLELIN